MRFVVTKTSMGLLSDERMDDEINKPIEQAYLSAVDCREWHLYRSFKEYDKKMGHIRGNFLDKGRDHRINDNGCIERTVSMPRWCIDVESIEELLEIFGDEEIIISSGDYNIPTIEIYDGFRE